MKKTIPILTIGLSLILTGCASNGSNGAGQLKNSNLTHGQVQLTLAKGETTKAKVLEVFGAPNITTIDASNQEVWTYQRHATVSNATSSSSFATIILAGGSGHTSGFEQSSNTITLIIKFDANDKVIDFKSRTSSF